MNDELLNLNPPDRFTHADRKAQRKDFREPRRATTSALHLHDQEQHDVPTLALDTEAAQNSRDWKHEEK